MYFVCGPLDATEVSSFTRPPPVHASSKQTNYSQESSNISTLSPLLARVFSHINERGEGRGQTGLKILSEMEVLYYENALQCNATQTKTLLCHALVYTKPL